MTPGSYGSLGVGGGRNGAGGSEGVSLGASIATPPDHGFGGRLGQAVTQPAAAEVREPGGAAAGRAGGLGAELREVGDGGAGPRLEPEGPAKHPVVIGWHHGTSSEVFIAGDFNDWSERALPMLPAGANEWVSYLELEAGTYHYKFIVDGQWVYAPDQVTHTHTHTHTLSLSHTHTHTHTLSLSLSLTLSFSPGPADKLPWHHPDRPHSPLTRPAAVRRWRPTCTATPPTLWWWRPGSWA